VKTDAHEEHLGPDAEWARSMTMALIFARCNQPSQVKVKADAEYWRVEYTFDGRTQAFPLRRASNLLRSFACQGAENP